jgi:hypothetical protein
VPFQPWAEALFKTRVANNAKDDPTSNCIVGGVPRSDFVPYPVQDHRDARPGDDPLRGRAFVPADLHGRPQAAAGSESGVVWLFSRTLGRRRVRRRELRLQRQRLAGQRRAGRLARRCA